MSKTYRTAVVLIPPHDVWPSIQAIRVEHDRHYRRWMPHITLLYPFRPRADWDGLLAPLSKACAGIGPFEVTLSGFDRFRHGRSTTLWLAPEPAVKLIALQTALWRVVPDCDDARRKGTGFTPHLSVGQVSSGGADRLLAALGASWEPVSFEAAEVQLIWRGDPPEDVFRVGERLELGRGPERGEQSG